MFYLTTHSTHFIYGYMASDIWLRTIPIMRKETRCRHIGYSFRLTARVLLYAPSHRQESTYHSLCYIVVEHWLEREIAQWVHPMNDRSNNPSHHERTLLPRSYISLRQGWGWGGRQPRNSMVELRLNICCCVINVLCKLVADC